MADINISCSSEQVKFQLMKKIKKDLASISLFNKTYIDFLDTGDYALLIFFVCCWSWALDIS